MPGRKAWQAVIHYGPPAGRRETLATANTLNNLLGKLWAAVPPESTLQKEAGVLIAIEMVCTELPQ